MAEDKFGGGKAIRLELSVPCDARFRQVLGAMSQKMASYVGYAEREATEVADMLVRAADGVFHAEGPSVYTTLDVTFATSDEEMEIRVRYVCADATGDANGPGIEHLLRQRGDGDAPLDVMQRVMRTVEFRRDNGVEICTLTKLLPDSE